MTLLDECSPTKRKPRVYATPTCPPGFITEAEFARQIGKHVRTLEAWRARGDLPAYLRIGQSIFYSVLAIKKWLRGKEIDPAKAAASSKKGGGEP